MDFTFSEEQVALRDVARQALERAVDPVKLRELADGDTGFDDELWHALVDLGWSGLLIPEEFGGSGAGLLEMCIVLEEMGRVPLPGPFFSSALYATLAARSLGAVDLLAGLASGVSRGAVALQEMGYGNPLETVRTRARRKGARWVLSGLKPLVLDAHSADWVIVVARSEEGVRSFLIEHPTAEVVPTLDPTRKAARMVLEDEPAIPIGPSGDQAALWRRVLDDVCVALASETVGVADRALSEAVEYSKVRVVFDRPIASFQAVKHRIVDMFHALEMARVGAQFAAWASDTDAPERERACAMAASYASEAGVRVTGDDIQIHGGVGFTWDNDAHFLFKRAKQNEVLMGGISHERHRLARMLVESA
ncbi:MAG: acyl-CoA dehydrogenase family protein [Acidimicrobiales bacterium]